MVEQAPAEEDKKGPGHCMVSAAIAVLYLNRRPSLGRRIVCFFEGSDACARLRRHVRNDITIL